MTLSSRLFSSAAAQVIGELSQELRRNLPPVDSAHVSVSDNANGLSLMVTGEMVIDGRSRIATLEVQHTTILAKMDEGPDHAMQVLTHTVRRIAGIMKTEMTGEQIEQLNELRGTDLSDADNALDALERALDV
jgi:hypothetical protein